MARTLVYEAQIRDTSDHTSDSAASDGDVTVNEDSLHAPNENYLGDAARARVYVDDTHDASFDVTLRHTHHDDTDDYSAEQDHTTYNVASGQDQTNITVTEPMGTIRFHFATGALTSAPTSGRIRIVVYVKQV